MGRVNFASIRRVGREPQTREFDLRDGSGEKVSFTFSRMGIAERMNVNHDKELLMPLITVPDDPIGNFIQASDGSLAKITPELCWLAANLANMQSGPPSDRYAPFDFLQMLINCPDLSEEVVSWMWEVNGGKTDEGN